jgi:hypothetical protein
MNRFFPIVLSFFGATASAQQIAWPSLPTTGYVKGKAATKDDVAAGKAVFVAARGEVVIGKPIPIQVPQYAWSTADGKKEPAIIIQAEEAGGQKLIGARLLSGGLVAGLIIDFELLGTKAPK